MFELVLAKDLVYGVVINRVGLVNGQRYHGMQGARYYFGAFTKGLFNGLCLHGKLAVDAVVFFDKRQDAEGEEGGDIMQVLHICRHLVGSVEYNPLQSRFQTSANKTLKSPAGLINKLYGDVVGNLCRNNL